MNYNTIIYPKSAQANFNTYIQKVDLPQKLCDNTKGYAGDSSAFWNCNICGNDKKYCQPVLPTDTLWFNFQEQDIQAERGTIASGWKGQTTPYLLGATLVACDGTEIPLETFDDEFLGGWFGLSGEDGRLFEVLWIKPALILSLLKSAEYDGCCFHFKFTLYRQGEEEPFVVKDFFSEEYCLHGCYDITSQTDVGNISQCEYQIETPDIGLVIDVTISTASITAERTLNFALYGLPVNIPNFVYLLNNVFGDIGIWYYKKVGADEFIGLWSIDAWLSFFINDIDMGSITCNTISTDDAPLGEDAPITGSSVRLCSFDVSASGAMAFPFTGIVNLNRSITGVTAVPITGATDWADLVVDLRAAVVDINWEYIIMLHQIEAACLSADKLISLTFTDDEDEVFFVSNGVCKTLAITAPEHICFEDCKPTVLLQGVYSNKDCDGRDYEGAELETTTGTTPYNFQLIMRLYCKVTLQGNEIEKATNVNGVVTSIKKRQTFRLLGSPVPPYVAQQILTALAAERIFIDGVEYLMGDITGFKPLDYTRMWRLDIKLKSKDCILLYGCD